MVRHADVHNPLGVVYGRLPRFGLSDIGLRQAEEIATFLSRLHVDDIYASPQLRARQTAGIIGKQVGVETVRVSSLIAEVRTGYQGRSNSSLNGKVNFYDNPASPDDEGISAIARRMKQFLDRTATRHRGHTVIAVSHADPIMILRARTLGLPLVIGSIQGRYYPSKCSITQFSFLDGDSRPIVSYHAPVVDVTDRPAPSSGTASVTEPQESEPKKRSAWLPRTAHTDAS